METFVGEKDTKQIIGNTFLIISFVLIGLIVAGLLVWSYLKTDILFITILSGIVLGYVLMMIIFIILIRAKLTEKEFRTYMTTSLFMGVLTFILFIVFLVRTIYHFRPAVPQKPPGAAVPAQQPTLAAQYNQYQEYPNPLLREPQPMNSLV